MRLTGAQSPRWLDTRIDERFAATRAYLGLQNAAEMGQLAVRASRAFIPPFDWWREAVAQYSTHARRIITPLALSISAYMIGYAVFMFGGVTSALGVGERLHGALYIALYREIAVWLTTMVFAGVAGSAVAADIGARKTREELDALSVLGVDLMRSLVIPRVIAMIVLAPTMGYVAILAGNVAVHLTAPGLVDYPPRVGLDSILSNIYITDILAYTVKLALVGFFVGIVSCQKGLASRGGSEGVGRAVNQAVVLSFFGIWVINSLFNLAYLSLFPETGVLKG